MKRNTALAVRARLGIGPIAIATLAIIGLLPAPGSAAAPAWRINVTPNPSSTAPAALYGIDCPTTTSCRAVGFSSSRGLTLRWNGADWATTATPAPADALYNYLGAVSCSATTNCRAVGSAFTNNHDQATVARWNGSGWANAAVPDPGSATDTELYDVACPTSSTCIAVGSAMVFDRERTLAALWDGSSWTVTPTTAPDGATVSALYGVGCVSATQCVAVGVARVGGIDRPIALRWDGTSWTRTPVPNPYASTDGALFAVSCAAASSCRAVGFRYVNGRELPLAMRWNGSDWAVTATPIPTGTTAALILGIDCPAAANCRAVGHTRVNGQWRPMTLRWNGGDWALTPTPTPTGATTTFLYDIACATSSNCRAVGTAVINGRNRTLSMRWA